MLEKQHATIKEERLAKKAPLTEADVKALLGSVSQVVIAKGKAARKQTAAETKPADLKGPTGNFRAPMVRKGKTLLVGFSPDVLEDFLR